MRVSVPCPLHRLALAAAMLLPMLAAGLPLRAQSTPGVLEAENRPLPSLREAVLRTRVVQSPVVLPVYEVPNRHHEDTRTQIGGLQGPDPVRSPQPASAVTPTLETSFDGASNDTNAVVTGSLVAPPDTDGDVGPNHYMQMINLVTTIFEKDGTSLGAFSNNAFWDGFGGVCETTNRGDPIVLYDETNDRWLVSQFAFNTSSGNPASPFVQCVAVSQTGDPTGGYNRYAFDLTSFGFNDYPKFGITTESITYMANLFVPPFFLFGGTLLGAMDKAAMYAGDSTATLVAANIGSGEFGFVAGDLDDPTGAAGFVPALFGTAMSTADRFDVWEIDVDWTDPGSATVGRIAQVPIAGFDNDLCTASREACVPQPAPGNALEALSGRLMHRLQLRDFGSYRTMVASHTVDADGTGRAGVRWYEFRETGGAWSLHQQGTYAPGDGLHRWMPSIAMNAAGDIGLGYMRSSTTDFVSTYFTGQTADSSGTGVMNIAEIGCIDGSGVQTGTARAGDYSATAIDPVTDTFWHTNEYMIPSGGSSFVWATRICEVSVPDTTITPPSPVDTVVVQNGWNLLGLPIDAPNAHYEAVFDTLPISQAYAYDPASGYVARDSLRNGEGFWMLFDRDTTIVAAGTPVDSLTISVADGWNLIAGPGCEMPVPAVTTTPPGLVASDYYGYDAGGYAAESAALEPWKGYWVLLSGAGDMTMVCP